MKSPMTWHYIFAKSTPRSNNINDLQPVPRPQVLKISLNADEGPQTAYIITERIDDGRSTCQLALKIDIRGSISTKDYNQLSWRAVTQ